MNLSREEQEQLRKEAIDHRDMLLDLRAVLATSSGKRFIKYLLKELDVGQLPVQGVEGQMLHDHLGFLRAGRSVFAIVSEANVEVAALILSEIEGDRQNELREIQKQSILGDELDDGL